MKKVCVVGFIVVNCLALSAAGNGDVVARFDGGIGVQPVLINAATFVAAANVVRGITPGLLPWTIHSLKAAVEGDGEIHVRGRGLVLAGGPPIGTRGDLASVRALLFCDGSTTPSASPIGVLDVDGDFTIDGALTPAVGVCPTPTLLIVVGAGTQQAPFRWIAAGIPNNDDRH
jgi:hypothetical protein